MAQCDLDLKKGIGDQVTSGGFHIEKDLTNFKDNSILMIVCILG